MAGVIVAWVAFSVLRVNEGRGLMIALVVGAVGAYVGGSVLAPMLEHSSTAADGFNPLALVVACSVAAACVYASDFVYERYGI